MKNNIIFGYLLHRTPIMAQQDRLHEVQGARRQELRDLQVL